LGRRFHDIGTRFRLDALRLVARRLKAEGAWQKRAIDALIEDFYAEQAELAGRAIAAGGDFEAWLAQRSSELQRLDQMVREIEATPTADIAMLTVATRALRGLLAG
jgi:NAD-specific glutamate dehydrogenase